MLTEKQVLNQLGIKDFRGIKKTHVLELASMLDKMDPEVAKKAIEQFPNFAKTVGEMFSEYKKIVEKALESNDNSTQTVYETYKKEIEICNELIKSNELTFENKKYLLDRIHECAKAIDKKDSENKEFLFNVIKTVAGVFAFCGCILGAVLGANAKLNNNN